MDDTPAATSLTVNGVDAELAGDGMLLFALREQLGLLGVRPGCGVGECGACTVLVDGQPSRSCTLAVRSVVGSQVTTPEGLGTPQAPHRIQQAFIDLQAAQCGYCVNGIIMTVAALDAAAAPVSDAQLLKALEDNVCRCGTHHRILQAARRVLDGAEVEPAGTTVDMLCTERSRCEVRRCAPVDAAADDAFDPVDVIPAELAEAPRVEDWLGLLDDGRVEVRSGRSELGQGVHLAVGQIAAAQLGISADDVRVRTAATRTSPDEWYTSGSRSVNRGGFAVAMAATAMRRLVLSRAANRLGVAPGTLDIVPGRVVRAVSGAEVSLAQLHLEGPIVGRIEATDRPVWSAEPLGTSPRRPDLAEKITGSGAFIHDVTLPGMVYARALMPPTYEAQLVELDTAGVESMPGVVAVVRDGRFVAVVAEGEEDAIRGVAALEARARWDDPGLVLSGDVVGTLRALPTTPHVARQDPGVDAGLRAGKRLSATFDRPYQAHGAMAPSCAVARFEGERLTIWTHTQGVHPVRCEIAQILALDLEAVDLIHVAGPGAYGQNGADDAAAFAGRLAMALPGTAVRFQYSSADEFAWEPQGSAMAADLEASLDDAGKILAWRHRGLTDTHTARPLGNGDRLALGWLREGGIARPWLGATEGGARNCVPLYDIPAVEAVAEHVAGPLRTGSLRSLGSFLNVFAMESFADELAELAELDPLEFRLRNVRDPRARNVLEVAAQAAGWKPHVGPSGRGQGLALVRYHDIAAYLAMVADVTVDFATDALTVDHITLAADPGTVVNVEGLRQQLEGGVMQGLSRTLYESLAVDRRGIRATDWSNYPVIRFGAVPTIEVIIVDRSGSRPLGAGEASTPAVAAAVANAIDDASGIRLRRVPFTTEAVRARLLELDDAEMARVLG